MNHPIPDFALVVCAPCSDSGNYVSILNQQGAIALDILTYDEFIEDAYKLKYSVLFLRKDGTWLYVKDKIAKDLLREEIQCILDKARFARGKSMTQITN